MKGPRVIALLLWVLVAMTASAAGPPSASAPGSAPAADKFATERHAENFRLRDALAKAPDAKAALEMARREVARTRALGRDDPARGDALELLGHAQLQAQKFAEALAAATELVRIRRAVVPADPLLLAAALELEGTALFGLDRSVEADARFREALGGWRQAFGPRDRRLAQKLEAHAEFVQGGFGRQRYVNELNREALAIREAGSDTVRGKLAERLISVAIGELGAGEYEEAERHLGRAASILKVEIESPRVNDDLRAMSVQVLVMRGALAARLGNRESVRRDAEAARRVTFVDRTIAVDIDLLRRATYSMQLEMLGDFEEAIDEQIHLLEAMTKARDLFASGRIDPAIEGDAWLRLAALLTAHGDPADAEDPLSRARQRLGDTSQVLFARAELARAKGAAAEALAHYRSALKLRKEDATEMTLFFGTSRLATATAEPGSFGGDAAPRLSFGTASVLVPGGSFTSANWMPARAALLDVGRATDASRLFVRQKRPLELAEWRPRVERAMRGRRLHPDAALVFVHGFNVSFDDALKRGAQLARDLNFDGPLAVFSWPSKGAFWRYGADRASADGAADRLAEFLDTFAASTGAKHVHVIAHSMGNRVLLPALAKVSADLRNAARERLGEVVLAAPAVPVKEFAGWLDAIVGQRSPARFTLYASAVDRAMWVGNLREWSSLAGYSALGVPLLHAAVQSIDISRASSGAVADLNHDVFASNPVMSEDIRQLLQAGPARRDPSERLPGIVGAMKGPGGLPYWTYAPKAALEPPRSTDARR